MPGKSSKYADKTEVPDSEDDLLASSPENVGDIKLGSSTASAEVSELPVEAQPASAIEPRDEQVSDTNSVTLPKDEKVLEKGVSTNDQSIVSPTAQQPTATEERTAPEEDPQESSSLMPMDQHVSDSPLVVRREEQASLADDMVQDGHSATASAVEAPSAPEEPAPVEHLQSIPAMLPLDGQELDSNSATRVEDQASLVEDMQTDDQSTTTSTAEAPNAPEEPVTQNETPTHTASTTYEDLSHASSSSPMSKTTPQKTTKSLKSDPATTLTTLTAERDGLLATFAALPTISPLLRQSPSSSNSVGPDPSTVLPIAKDLITTHIKLLHTYNEIKDIGQGLMGLLADQRGVRIKEVQEEFGVGGKD
ncbi:uncharacterized protein BDZ99DRAFT_461500 [Mytilinidion resinicola]|uniref:Swi5-domain-containing protein n=1 Tax=Mytilinidion resinicola TaxID=574789 RepID=A0A6A6YST5_9PEZI|nr:uncharacterized protein BDZ99DRAFT_461500 [Mytilinidion resinicola]KAF2811433.1 hypothetical protein BDZ99DRAFT_461500 [Mytilinidion resinicola]